MSESLLSLRRYDPERDPRNWTGHVQSHQFGVIQFNAKTRIAVATDGRALASGSDDILIFRSLENAVAFSRTLVDKSPSLGCMIFNAREDLEQTIVNEEFDKKLRRPAGKREVIFGILLMTGGILLILLDYHLNWFLMLGVIIGVRLLIGGVLQLASGVSGMRSRSKTRERSSHS